MQCYYSAAITAAYLCAPDSVRQCNAATALCDEIWNRYGGPIDPNVGNDQRKKAELLSNNCYYDVAKITRNPPTCEGITQRDNFGTTLMGSTSTLETCRDEVNRLADLAPERYYETGADNICSLVLILPFVLVIRSRYP
jgi:hypothetical protein